MNLLKNILLISLMFPFSNSFADNNNSTFIIDLNSDSNEEGDADADLNEIKRQLDNLLPIEEKIHNLVEESLVMVSISEVDLEVIDNLSLDELIKERDLIIEFNSLFTSLHISFDTVINHSKWDNFASNLTVSDQGELRDIALDYSSTEIGIRKLKSALDKINTLIDQKLSLEE